MRIRAAGNRRDSPTGNVQVSEKLEGRAAREREPRSAIGEILAADRQVALDRAVRRTVDGQIGRLRDGRPVQACIWHLLR